jgi:hypothetical protein
MKGLKLWMGRIRCCIHVPRLIRKKEIWVRLCQQPSPPRPYRRLHRRLPWLIHVATSSGFDNCTNSKLFFFCQEQARLNCREVATRSTVSQAICLCHRDTEQAAFCISGIRVGKEHEHALRGSNTWFRVDAYPRLYCSPDQWSLASHRLVILRSIFRLTKYMLPFASPRTRMRLPSSLSVLWSNPNVRASSQSSVPLGGCSSLSLPSPVRALC